jgi:hypothetical protein
MGLLYVFAGVFFHFQYRSLERRLAALRETV